MELGAGLVRDAPTVKQVEAPLVHRADQGVLVAHHAHVAYATFLVRFAVICRYLGR